MVPFAVAVGSLRSPKVTATWSCLPSLMMSNSTLSPGFRSSRAANRSFCSLMALPLMPVKMSPRTSLPELSLQQRNPCYRIYPASQSDKCISPHKDDSHLLSKTRHQDSQLGTTEPICDRNLLASSHWQDSTTASNLIVQARKKPDQKFGGARENQLKLFCKQAPMTLKGRRRLTVACKF